MESLINLSILSGRDVSNFCLLGQITSKIHGLLYISQLRKIQLSDPVLTLLCYPVFKNALSTIHGISH